MNPSKGRRVAVLGLVVLALTLMNASSTQKQGSLTATVYPNLDQAREEGFHLIAGHPPFVVNFYAEVEGGEGALSYDWDLDGDGVSDSDAPDPQFTYTQPGEYTASVSISDERGQEVQAEQRIVVIGEPEWPDWRFGVVAHFDKDESDDEKDARMIADGGIEAVRLDLSWAEVQPNGRYEYEWGKYDSLVALCRRYELGLLPIIVYSSEWASTARDAVSPEDRIFAPPSPAEYAWFAYEAADRYKADVRAWEVWNEPNLSRFWRPEPDPALYAELLKQAYLAIKYADPKAVVVLGGLTNYEGARAPEEFLQVVYDQGGESYFDAVGSHPYTDPSAGIERLTRKLDGLRTVMADNGDGEKPIWATEYGTPTVLGGGVTEKAQGVWLIQILNALLSSLRGGVTEKAQAAWLTQSLNTLLSANRATVVFWYDFRDDGNDPKDPEQNFGLVKRDFEIKPAYQAYKDYISQHRGP